MLQLILSCLEARKAVTLLFSLARCFSMLSVLNPIGTTHETRMPALDGHAWLQAGAEGGLLLRGEEAGGGCSRRRLAAASHGMVGDG